MSGGSAKTCYDLLLPSHECCQLIPKMARNGTVFEARLEQASVLKKVIEAVKDLISEGLWHCTSTGISLQGMDGSHVALVHVLLRSEGFEPYRCTRNISMGISLVSMAKVLKSTGNDDTIVLSHENSSNVVTFALSNVKEDRHAEFDLKLMNLDSNELSVPETEYDAIIKMPSVEFRKICQDLLQFGDSVTISCADQDVSFETSGDIGKGRVRQKARSNARTPDQDVSVEITQPVSLIFALKYLNFFTKATPLSDIVRLCMCNNHPLCVEYPISDIGFIRYYLAPKIGEESD